MRRQAVTHSQLQSVMFTAYILQSQSLAFDVLEAVAKEVDVPLVLHGASGIGDEDIKKAISLGIAKINIHTELCQAAMEAINAHKDEPFLAVEREVRKAVKERAMYKIKLFGDDGRADE